MNIALLGYDIEGHAAYDYWNKPGNTITICDRDTQVAVPDGVQSQLGTDYLHNLDRFDVLVRTPGLHPRDITTANPSAPGILQKVTTVTNEFMRVCPTANIIGVTGTKGKGTTSSLIAAMLQAAGKKVHLGGNIGIAPLAMLQNNIQPEDYVVLELSNFQLIDITYSPRIAVCLMIVPEHLNWHADFAEYVEAKKQLVAHQTSEDTIVYNAGNHTSISIAQASQAAKQWYYAGADRDAMPGDTGVRLQNGQVYIGDTAVCADSEIALLGRHNRENVCAAVAAVWNIIDGNVAAIRSVVTTFRGLPHRLELIRSLNGVAYYDDSFGTTPETAMVAIQAFAEPKIVILGGSDKGAAYDELAQTVATSNVKQVLLIGETGPAIEAALHRAGYHNALFGGRTMAEVAATAQSYPSAGDVVLLSTGCASFDMFKNYKDRGEQFQQAVAALPA